MKETMESKLNFSNSNDNSRAVELKAREKESYYQEKLSEYYEDNGIDYSEDNCSAMIMSDYGAENDTFWFWIDK